MRHKITFKKENITPDSAVEEFLENKRLMGLSKATLTTYCDHLNMFLTAVSCDSMDDITQQSISQFVSFMMDRNVTGQTINSYLRTIRVFLRWCAGKEYLGEVKVTMVRSDSRLKDTYTDAELRLLLGHKPKKKEGFRVYQIWVLENYLLATGNRIGSALGLQIQDIDLTEATVRLRRTKGRRQQIIPLQDSLVAILAEYLSVRGGNAEDYVFCNVYGGQGDRRTFQEAVHDYNIRHGVSKTSCHLFRHTFTKKCVLAGVSLPTIQRMLGHKDITTTQNYINLVVSDMQIDMKNVDILNSFRHDKIQL